MMNICSIHNKITKLWFFILGELEWYIPDNEVSLGYFILDLLSIIILPALITFGILFRIYKLFPSKYNVFNNLTFKCERHKEKFKWE